MRGGRAEAFEDRQHFAIEDQIRRAAIARRNFHVLPANPTAPASLQCFQRRFFCREARCIMLWGYRAARVAVLPFRCREDSFSKPRRADEYFANPRNFDNVYTDGNDHN